MPETNPERINPFLIHDFGRVDLPSTFYARIDQVEPGEPEGNEPLTILFDCVGADWVDEVINSDDIWPLLPQAPLAVIQVEVSPPATRGERGAPGSSWARLSFDQEGGIPALRYDNLFGEAEAGFLHPPEPVDFQTAARLDLHFSLDRIPDIDEEQLSALLTPALEADFINVLDVGQGNCNALWKTAGNALLYFDAGGGVLQHAGTFPAGRGFCEANEAPVILSHWDWDHWSSALRPGCHVGT